MSISDDIEYDIYSNIEIVDSFTRYQRNYPDPDYNSSILENISKLLRLLNRFDL